MSVAAEHSDEILALVLLSTTLFFDGWNVSRLRGLLPLAYFTPIRYFASVSEKSPYGLKNEKLRREVARDMQRSGFSHAGTAAIPMTAIFQAHRLIKSVKNRLSKVRTPTLLIHGVEDDVASVKSADYVQHHIGSNRVEKVLLSDSYHMITLDNEHRLVADRTLCFLRDAIQQRAHQGPSIDFLLAVA
ncbi:MAG: alpha/beta hydrolase [Burkholderiales bacterium]